MNTKQQMTNINIHQLSDPITHIRGKLGEEYWFFLRSGKTFKVNKLVNADLCNTLPCNTSCYLYWFNQGHKNFFYSCSHSNWTKSRTDISKHFHFIVIINKTNETSIMFYSIFFQMCNFFHGEFVGPACGHHGPYIPDVLFWSIILFFTTFFLSSFLKQFKTERYFPTKVKCLYIHNFE